MDIDSISCLHKSLKEGYCWLLQDLKDEFHNHNQRISVFPRLILINSRSIHSHRNEGEVTRGFSVNITLINPSSVWLAYKYSKSYERPDFFFLPLHQIARKWSHNPSEARWRTLLTGSIPRPVSLNDISMILGLLTENLILSRSTTGTGLLAKG
ncbi:unnamed protein product [Lactuca saligna]|uniref:Uncharacterized protein n=1 Tax=Lactuca saligna TaxID=75948 RepID=A0AA35ZNG0_LACSI|nr:unnamed protein product [Lactuca saligna]